MERKTVKKKHTDTFTETDTKLEGWRMRKMERVSVCGKREREREREGGGGAYN